MIKTFFVVVLNVTGEYLWVCSNDPLMDSKIAYINVGARVNVWFEINFWVILGASNTDINRWDVVFDGEGHSTSAGYTIVNMHLSANNK